ncbi:hypothetical protein [Pseudomonas phage vB_PaeM_FBPa50]|uniref:Structural protein n=1 Tax=Pseudomonas phage SL1 TaxID=2041215 RepID=A0A2I7SBT0_9CAUD|nr:baseplate wedge subunit [Pseudomonas phage SL1]AUS03345.1 structural protein [Pseudomonas phage SL1]USL88801.1 hypothetical protein [Pseudomonas phage vB_PaeM_FBPa50]UTQ79730.1 hypothetical protein FBPa50_0046 [Pseudomonas phage vB_PaeM_FBPa50]
MSTSTIRTGTNNDILLDDNGNMVILRDVEACAQDVRAAMLMRTGENIFDVNSGVGYFEYIFSPQKSYDDARKSIADAILSSPDVTGIEQLNIDITGEVFGVDAKVITIHGPVTTGV